MKPIRFFLSIPLALAISIVHPTYATERGMTGNSDFRLGPIFHGGFTLFSEQPANRQYYLLEIRGENPKNGYSRIYLRAIGLYELLELPQLNTPEPSPIERQVRFHHQFFTMGVESPILYSLTRPMNFEWGWGGGFTMARVVFKSPEKPQSLDSGVANLFSDFPEIPPGAIAQQKQRQTDPDSQFMGGEIGSYFRLYTLYPFVPHISAKLSLGNFLDTTALIQGIEDKPDTTSTLLPTPVPTGPPQVKRVFQSTFQLGTILTAGLDYHLFSRGIFGFEYVLWNWNLSRPEDLTHSLIFKAGFLF